MMKRKGLVSPSSTSQRAWTPPITYSRAPLVPKEIPNLGAGIVYVNKLFYDKKIFISVEILPKIKEYLDSFNNPRIKGINIHYSYASNRFIKKQKK